jgi:hypothetical protein
MSGAKRICDGGDGLYLKKEAAVVGGVRVAAVGPIGTAIGGRVKRRCEAFASTWRPHAAMPGVADLLERKSEIEIEREREEKEQGEEEKDRDNTPVND